MWKKSFSATILLKNERFLSNYDTRTAARHDLSGKISTLKRYVLPHRSKSFLLSYFARKQIKLFLKTLRKIRRRREAYIVSCLGYAFVCLFQ